MQTKLPQRLAAFALAASVMGCSMAPVEPLRFGSHSLRERTAAETAELARLRDIFLIVQRSSYTTLAGAERKNLAIEVRRIGIESRHENAAGLALDIFSAMKNDDDDAVRKEVAHGACLVGTMEKSQKKKATGIMTTMIGDPDEIIRETVAECIVTLKDGRYP